MFAIEWLEQILLPEFPVRLEEMLALIATISVHAVRVYHEVEFLAFTMESIKKLESILVMDIVVSCTMSDLQHHRFVLT